MLSQIQLFQLPLLGRRLSPAPLPQTKTEIISRMEAIAFLSKTRSYNLEEVWNGSGFARGEKRKVSRHQRSPGGSVDVINYDVLRLVNEAASQSTLGVSAHVTD